MCNKSNIFNNLTHSNTTAPVAIPSKVATTLTTLLKVTTAEPKATKNHARVVEMKLHK